MVPQTEIMNVRLKFTKKNDLMYISHLDLAKTMQRIIVRSDIDIWYSEGFNPQPRLVFAVPLPVGVESECELMDIKLNSKMELDEIKARISRNLPRDMELLDVYVPERKFKNIEYIDYTITISSPYLTDSVPKAIEELFSKECRLIKKSKSGDKEVDITPLVKLVTAKKTDSHLEIHAILCADSEKYLNPELFVEAIRANLSILNPNNVDEYYTVLRNKMLDSELNEFK